MQITKNIPGNISNNFCLNITRVKRRVEEGTAGQVKRGTENNQKSTCRNGATETK